MLTPRERLDQIELVLLELEDESEKLPIIVEGRKDERALASLGIRSNVIGLGKGVSIFAFCEMLSKKFKKAIILTDWDRRGGKLARDLKEALMANGVGVNDSLRTQLVILSKKEIKDIESLPTFFKRLKELAEGERTLAKTGYRKYGKAF